MSGHFSFPEVLDIEDETVEETSVVKAATPPPQHPPVPPAALPLDEVTEELDREDAAFRERFERLQLWRIGQYESLDEWKLVCSLPLTSISLSLSPSCRSVGMSWRVVFCAGIALCIPNDSSSSNFAFYYLHLLCSFTTWKCWTSRKGKCFVK